MFSLPLYAYCSDNGMDKDAAQGCIFMCLSCHNATLPDIQTHSSFTKPYSKMVFCYFFDHQDPILEKAHRPPIHSS